MSEFRHSLLPRPASTGGIADPERLMRAVRRSMGQDTRAVTNPQTEEPAKHESDKEDTLNKLADRIVSKERPASGGLVAKKEESVIVNAANVRDAITGILYLIEDTLTAMMTQGPDDRKTYGDSRMAVMMQAMVDRTVSAKMEYVDFEIRLRQTLDNIISSPRYLVKVAEALLNTEEVLEPVADVVKKMSDKVTEVSPKREDRIERFFWAAEKPFSARSSLLRESPPTDISDDGTYKRAYSDTDSEEEELPRRITRKQDRRRKKLRKLNKSKYAYKSGHGTILKVIEPVNDLFRKAVDYRSYRLIKQSARYDDDVAHELHRMARKSAVQMKDRTFPGKDLMSVTTFLQDFKSACDPCGIHEGAGLWLFKQYLTGPAEAAGKSHVLLPNYVNTGHEGALRTYSEVVNFLLKRYAADENIANLDNEVRGLQQRTLSQTVFAKLFWSKTLTCGSVYDERDLKAMFVEGVQSSNRKRLEHWWAEHQDALLEDLTQKGESLLDLQGHKMRREQLMDIDEESPRRRSYRRGGRGRTA